MTGLASLNELFEYLIQLTSNVKLRFERVKTKTAALLFAGSWKKNEFKPEVILQERNVLETGL